MPWSNDLDKKIKESKETKQDSKSVWKDLDSEIERGKRGRMWKVIVTIALLLFACGFFLFIVEMIKIGAGQ